MPAVSQNPTRTLFWALGFGLTAALLLGAALTERGPSGDLNPELAAAPIAIPGQTPIYVMKYEVTVTEWNRCFDAAACQLQLRTRPNQDPHETPATGLSYIDVSEYVAWINAQTDIAFRLPTVAEWEHIAHLVLPEEPDPIFTDPELTWASSYLLEEQSSRALRPRGAFSTSPDGVVDLDGNVWEWTQDCYAGTADGDPSRCPAFFVAGEHIAAMSFLVRDPARGGCAVGSPPAHLGMRLVRDAT